MSDLAPVRSPSASMMVILEAIAPLPWRLDPLHVGAVLDANHRLVVANYLHGRGQAADANFIATTIVMAVNARASECATALDGGQEAAP